MWTRTVSVVVATIAVAATAAAELPPSISGSRPGAPDQATEVIVATLLLDVSEVAGASQSFTADLFVLLRWHDPRLAGVFDGTRQVGLDEIWTPRLQIVNRRTLDTTFPELAEIETDGTVTVRQRYFGSFATHLDLRDFPLDRQRFEIRLVVPGSVPEELHLVPVGERAVAPGDGAHYSVADWALADVVSEPSPYRIAPGVEPLSGWRVAFEGRRRLGYWIGIALVSVTIIAAMSWIVFWLDPKYVPPRISVAVTSMLTLIAYRFLLGSSLPKLAYLTRMDLFLIGSTLLVLLSIVQVAVTTHLVDRDQGSLAQLVNRRSRWIFPAAYAALLLVVAWAP
jgi:hypothetical protein